MAEIKGATTMKITLVEELKKKCDDECDSTSITNGETTHGGFSACSGCLEAFLRKKETEINEQIDRKINKIKKASFRRGYNLGLQDEPSECQGGGDGKAG